MLYEYDLRKFTPKKDLKYNNPNNEYLKQFKIESNRLEIQSLDYGAYILVGTRCGDIYEL